MTLSYSIVLVILAANCTAILTCFSPDRRRFFLFIAAVAVITLLSLINILLLHDPLNIFRVIPRGTQYLPTLYLLQKGNLAQKTFFTFSMLTVSALAPIWGGYCANIFFTYGTSAHETAAFAAAFMMLTVYVALMLLRGKWLYQRIFLDNRFQIWTLYSLYPIAAMSALNVIFYAEGTTFPAPEQSDIVYLLMTLFIFAGFVILCTAIINTHEKTKQRLDAEFARGIVSSGQNHYQKMNEMYDKFRTLRHDYKYHLNAARKMLHSGGAQEAALYLNSVEKQLSEYELEKYCTNVVINALIASYAERCARLGIEFTVKVDIPEAFGVADYDMCIILGNLLENAVEACAKLERDRMIILETHIKSSQLLVMVKNSFDGVIHKKNDMPISLKENGGFGLRSITEVIDRYGGDLLTEWDTCMFTAYAAVGL